MRKFDSINVIPFIDIMLVLLAIVLTTATFVSKGQLDIALPVTSTTEQARVEDYVEIAIDKEASIYFNGASSTLALVRAELEGLDSATRIKLLIDETVEFKEFVSLIDILKELSLDRISVITRKKN